MPSPAVAAPAVTVGLPVYNGETYLNRAIKSVLAQTWADLELVVSDNASTDGTEKICRSWAATDSRIRYFRQKTNIGAGPNYNHTLELARGEYFCWLAHDDWFDPDYLERCLKALFDDSGRILSYAMMGVVDESGQVFREQHEKLVGLDDPVSRRRFHSIIWNLGDPTSPVFGVMPTAILRSVGGLPLVPEPDRHLLYALSLRGRFHALPEVSFFHHGPPGHAAHYGSGRMRRRSWEWLHPDFSGRLLAKPLRVLTSQLSIVARSDISLANKIVCCVDVLAAVVVRRSVAKGRSLTRAFRRRLT